MNGLTLGRWLRFNGAGLLGVGVQMGVLALLLKAQVAYLAAVAVAVECALIHNFLWHERWTWAERARAAPGEWFRRLARFHLANGLISFGGNLVLMWWLVGVLGGPALISNLFSIALCGTVNFVAGDVFVFREPADDGFRGGSLR